ncbi:MAG: hypothetical protein M1828_002149 [Chrysothrix sp. TS-e1954]|nr:MAG: hypothetical protein M1828_002149 [Chrysothrix sp. TS-e1954]
MPKFFCDYCDVYLTHDSMSVRKAHNSGRNHLRNVVDYYQQIGHEKAQSVIDSITSSYAAEGQASSNPMLQQQNIGPGAPPFGAPPPFGMPPGGLPPMGMHGGGRKYTACPDARLVLRTTTAPPPNRGMPFPPPFPPPGGPGGPGQMPFPPPFPPPQGFPGAGSPPNGMPFRPPSQGMSPQGGPPNFPFPPPGQHMSPPGPNGFPGPGMGRPPMR